MPRAKDSPERDEPVSKKLCSGTPQFKLTYFNYRWLAEPIRFMFEYKGEEFDDVRIKDDEWDGVKINYRYGVLPVLEEHNGLKHSQSFSIARYLAKKFHLAGENDVEAAKCDEIADCLKDILQDVRDTFSDDEAKKTKAKETVASVTAPKFLTTIEADLKVNGGKFLVGKGLTWADFELAHWTDMLESVIENSILDKYPTIKEHQQHIFNLPQIKAWIEKRPVTEY